MSVSIDHRVRQDIPTLRIKKVFHTDEGRASQEECDGEEETGEVLGDQGGEAECP